MATVTESLAAEALEEVIDAVRVWYFYGGDIDQALCDIPNINLIEPDKIHYEGVEK